MTSHKADSRHCRFLHNIAERAGKLDFARAVKNGGFNSEHFAAHACPGKSVDYAHRRFGFYRLWQIYRRADKLLKVFCLNADALFFAGYNFNGGFSAKRSDFLLKLSHTRLARVAVNNGAYRVITDFKCRCRKPVELFLLRHKMLFGYAEFFLRGVARQFDNFHSVKQRSRDC